MPGRALKLPPLPSDDKIAIPLPAFGTAQQPRLPATTNRKPFAAIRRVDEVAVMLTGTPNPHWEDLLRKSPTNLF